MSIKTKSENITVGTKKTLSIPTEFTESRSGKQIIGWNTKADGSGVSYALNQVLTMPDNDLVLYAMWGNKTYTVTLYSNDGKGNQSTSSIAHGNTYTAGSCPFTSPSGKLFDYWSTSPSGGSRFTSTTVTSNLNLYAIWKDDIITSVNYINFVFSGTIVGGANWIDRAAYGAGSLSDSREENTANFCVDSRDYISNKGYGFAFLMNNNKDNNNSRCAYFKLYSAEDIVKLNRITSYTAIKNLFGYNYTGLMPHYSPSKITYIKYPLTSAHGYSGAAIKTSENMGGLGGCTLNYVIPTAGTLITKIELNPLIITTTKHTTTSPLDTFSFNDSGHYEYMNCGRCTGSGCTRKYIYGRGGQYIVIMSLSDGSQITKKVSQTNSNLKTNGWKKGSTLSTILPVLTFDFSSELRNKPKSIYTTRVTFGENTNGSSTSYVPATVSGIKFYKN